MQRLFHRDIVVQSRWLTVGLKVVLEIITYIYKIFHSYTRQTSYSYFNNYLFLLFYITFYPKKKKNLSMYNETNKSQLQDKYKITLLIIIERKKKRPVINNTIIKERKVVIIILIDHLSIYLIAYFILQQISFKTNHLRCVSRCKNYCNL